MAIIARQALHRLGDLYNAIRIRIRKRMQQHLIDHAEHRSVGTDSQGQRDDCNQGEPGALSELAHCISEILKKSGHSCSPHSHRRTSVGAEPTVSRITAPGGAPRPSELYAIGRVSDPWGGVSISSPWGPTLPWTASCLSSPQANRLQKVTHWLQEKERMLLGKQSGSLCPPTDSRCPEANRDVAKLLAASPVIDRAAEVYNRGALRRT